MRNCILLLTLIIISCSKEKSTSYKASILNNTSHRISIFMYYGRIVPIDSIILSSGKQIEIANGFDRGIVDHMGFASEKISNNDSIVVIFDDLYRIAHYFSTPVSYSFNYYNYSSERNLMNYLSYNYTFKDVSKVKRSAFYDYIFTEQDYLNASK